MPGRAGPVGLDPADRPGAAVSIERIRAAADSLEARPGSSAERAAVVALLRAVADTHGHYPECSCDEYSAATRVAEAVETEEGS